jgi:hypothetical protein
MQEKGAPIKPKRDREDESTSNAQRAPDGQAGRLHPKNAAPSSGFERECGKKVGYLFGCGAVAEGRGGFVAFAVERAAGVEKDSMTASDEKAKVTVPPVRGRLR